MASTKKDQLAIIRIDGMHCHQCEKQIQQALAALPGVREVEVDFPSAQASVLYVNSQIKAEQLIDTIRRAGYKVAGLVNSQPTSNKPSP